MKPHIVSAFLDYSICVTSCGDFVLYAVRWPGKCWKVPVPDSDSFVLTAIPSAWCVCCSWLTRRSRRHLRWTASESRSCVCEREREFVRVVRAVCGGRRQPMIMRRCIHVQDTPSHPEGCERKRRASCSEREKNKRKREATSEKQAIVCVTVS